MISDVPGLEAFIDPEPDRVKFSLLARFPILNSLALTIKLPSAIREPTRSTALYCLPSLILSLAYNLDVRR